MAITDVLQLDRLKSLRAGGGENARKYDYRISDGAGLRASAELVKLTIEGAQFEIGEFSERPNPDAPHPERTLVLPILRRSALETAVEQVSQFDFYTRVLLYFGEFNRYSQEKFSTKKIARLQKIAISSVNQSLSLFLPQIEMVGDLEAALLKIAGQPEVVYPHINSTDSVDSASEAISTVNTSSSNLVVAIGAEGGFSPSELELLQKHNGKEISLGNSILRSETAAVATTSLLVIS